MDNREWWWIASTADEPWAGMRIAVFDKAVSGEELVFILAEEPRRSGVRVWSDIQDREGWRKVQRIPVPTEDQIRSVMSDQL